MDEKIILSSGQIRGGKSVVALKSAAYLMRLDYKKKIKIVALILGGSIGVTCYLVLLWVFIIYIVSGQTQITLDINSLGEASFEAIMMILLFPTVIYTYLQGMKDMRRILHER